ncbi:hypothetical protein UlMin_046019 [Ulmus minor]
MNRLRDWNCMSCQHLNFQRHDSCQRYGDPNDSSCFKCGAFKDDGGFDCDMSRSRAVGVSGAGGGQFEHNFASRMECFRCNTPRDSF